MKPDYKNWMPKGMIYAFLTAFLGCAAALVIRDVYEEIGSALDGALRIGDTHRNQITEGLTS